MADQQYFYGTGRRKTAVARVRLYPGNGAIVVNGKPLEEVFSRDSHRQEVTSPLRRLGREARFSAQIKCEGGGVTGWAGAIQMGIARALVASDASLKPSLKRGENLLTRDPRMKER
jgi:small subunit ribosomal protein S9